MANFKGDSDYDQPITAKAQRSQSINIILLFADRTKSKIVTHPKRWAFNPSVRFISFRIPLSGILKN
ncbi:hypothetical protein D3OALGB2SA_4045 [Olavius algarvensis associated proteobacterium Delta 3]|nr:hypothetical protein D3OALGB2SA_4045 [Olavius algarvensis associated proteobacterium Delta 3]